MRRAHVAFTLASASAVVLCFATTVVRAAEDKSSGSPRIVKSFDDDWRFFKGDAEGSEAVGIDDSSWRKLDVPHDWSIEGPFDEKNPTGGAGGFLPAGTAGIASISFCLRAPRAIASL